jgi:cytochrome b pre-mRNA-processing protein 3
MRGSSDAIESNSSMFQHLFGRKRRISEAVVISSYEAIVAASRQEHLYSTFLVPDTPLGRFEAISAHLIVFLRRTKNAAAPLPDLAQEVVEEFFKDVDHSMRELGIGDPSIPKRMKKMARMFYGRAESYGAALEGANLDELSAALHRNIRPDEDAWPQSKGLAQHIAAADAALQTLPDDEIASGKVRFPLPSIIPVEG